MNAPNQIPRQDITSNQIEQWLKARLADLLSIDAAVIRGDEAMTRYGLDSRRATQLVADLGTWLGRTVSPVLIWEHPTVAALARHLGPDGGDTPRRTPSRPQSSNNDEPIAVVGVACRFPGGDDRETFWQTLCDGRHVVQQIDDERWSIDRYHGEDPQIPGRAHTRWASLLPQEQIEGFDPLFFNISPREAEDMDPQQRLFLELSWEAFQDGGVRPFSIAGADVGVFAGVIWDDYGEMTAREPSAISMHTATGKACGMVANRVSYTFGLEGPSIVVDTACSSSLVAIHLACQSLRTNDCSMAIAGGVNLLLGPLTMVGLAKFGGLSTDSRCKAFDASADGFVRGEGGGAVLLKPLSAAIADGDHIYAVVRGTAINNDGASNGLTAPSPGAQRRLLEQAYARSGVEPSQIDYVEAHGTGTSLGDPIEAKALGTVLCGSEREQERRLRIGSVKTNIGHLEAAAGVAGFIKTVLSVERGVLPPSLHFDTPNPHIPFDELGLRVQDQLEPWPASASEQPRRAGVSAFGWGGTNCHVVVESAPKLERAVQWRASAGDELALQAAAQGLTATDAASTICGGAHRLAITTDDPERVSELAAAAIGGGSSPEFARGQAVAEPRLAFVCSPQGGQWRGMARGLLADEPVFRDAIHTFDAAYAEHADWSLLDALVRDDADWAWSRVHTLQPMILAVQVGLAALWRSWGVVPDMYIGHSLGEITAAHLCGALDVADTARVVIHYSRLQATTDDVGTMAIIGLPVEQVQARLPADTDAVAIAGVNSPDSVTLSGPREILAPLVESLQAEHCFARFIDVNVAAHSPRIDAIMEQMRECMRPIVPRPAHTPMLSTATGQELTGLELGVEYWPTNLRDKVRFADMVGVAIDRGVTALVELNPHPILVPAIEQTLRHHGHHALVLGSTRRGQSERRAMLEGLGQLYVTGHDATRRPVLAAARCRDRARVDDPAALVSSAQLAIPVSGRSAGGLDARVERLRAQCADASSQDLARTSFVLDGGFEHRLTLLCDEQLTPSDALQALDDPDHHAHVRDVVDPQRSKKIVFVCPGQGSQWHGMARDLLATQPAFREEFLRVDRLATAYLERPLLDELLQDDGNLDRIDVVQPLLFAVEVALGALWRSWGVVPDAVIGHSMGEVAATHLSGALPLPDAVAVICTRSALLRSKSGQGAMLAAEITVDEAAVLVKGHERTVAIAVSNSPSSTVLSGDAEVLEQLRQQLDARGVFCRFVKVDVASHSPQMDPLLDELADQLASVRSRSATVPIYSTVDRQPIDGTALGADYWVRNLRETVHFSEAIGQLLHDGHDVFIELSPHPILLPAVEQCIDAAGRDDARVVPSMRRKEPGVGVMLHGAACLRALGHDIDWPATMLAGRRLRWAGEAWDRERYWAPQHDDTSGGWVAQGHPLLGPHIPNALHDDSHLWQLDLSTAAVPWLADHRVQQSTIVSAAVYVEMVLAAAAQQDQGPLELTALTFDNPLVLPDSGARRVQIAMSGAVDGAGATLGLFSQDDDERDWLSHARGRVTRPVATRAVDELATLREQLTEAVDTSAFYEGLVARGLDFGPAFQSVQQLWVAPQRALARVELPACAAAGHERFGLHPVLLDGALQVLLATLSDQNHTFLTVGLERLAILVPGPHQAVWSHARVRADGQDWLADVSVFADDGTLVGRIQGLRLVAVARQEDHDATVDAGGPPVMQALRVEDAGVARRRRFEVLVREQVGAVLKMPGDRVEPRRPLQAMGLTSLMTVELRNRLGRLLGVRLPATLVWNYPTLEVLLPHLETKLPLSLDDDDADVANLSAATAIVPRARAHTSPAPDKTATMPVDPVTSRSDDPEDEIEVALLEELSRMDSLLSSI